MQADTWEGEFNGPASPSTMRENIEVRFLFYSIAGGLGVRQKDKKEKKKHFWRRVEMMITLLYPLSNVTFLLYQSC